MQFKDVVDQWNVIGYNEFRYSATRCILWIACSIDCPNEKYVNCKVLNR